MTVKKLRAYGMTKDNLLEIAKMLFVSGSKELLSIIDIINETYE